MESKLKLLLNWLSEQNESTVEYLYWFLVDEDDYYIPSIIGKSRWENIKYSVIEEYKYRLEKAESELDKLIEEYKNKKEPSELDKLIKEFKDGKR